MLDRVVKHNVKKQNTRCVAAPHPIRNDQEILEKKPLEKATNKNELAAFKHFGFWKCMDVKRDRDELQKIYKNNKFKF